MAGAQKLHQKAEEEGIAVGQQQEEKEAKQEASMLELKGQKKLIAAEEWREHMEFEEEEEAQTEAVQKNLESKQEEARS